MKAYKGFDKDLKCRGFQYEAGKEYETENAKLCESGFHACENPLNTLSYYKPGESRYCEVELDATEERSDDSKRVGKRIKIETEIGLKGVIEAGVKFVFDKCEGATERAASGRSGNAAASGRYGNAAASGWYGNAAASGWYGNASTKNGVAAAIGFNGNAKGGDVGSYIVLADWRFEKGEWNLHGVEARKVDGEIIKAGVWYTMKEGKVVEA